jgi:putative oligomerization/nucleic acid binding protein
MMMRRRGPGIVRMAATTAVVAGTAGAVRHHQEQKYANQAAEQAAAQQAQYEAAPVQEAPAPAAAAPGDDMMAQITQLSQLHNAGVLSDEEFAAAKAKLLA